MRSRLKHRLVRLEMRSSLPEVRPFVVYGYNGDGEPALLWAGWLLDSKCKSWHENSGTAPPAELTALIEKYQCYKSS